MKPRKTVVRVIAVLALLSFMVSVASAASRTFTGVVTDDMCAKNGSNRHTMAPGQSDAECVRGCVQAGAHYALFTDDKKVYILKGDANQVQQFDSLAARQVKITGDVTGNTITVKSITAAEKSPPAAK